MRDQEISNYGELTRRQGLWATALIIVVVVVVFALLAACDDKPSPNKNFVMIGDSIIEMMGQYQKQLPNPFDGAINLGVGGQSSTQIRSRIGTVPAGTPMLLLEGGINNIDSPDTIVQDYTAMLSSIPVTTGIFMVGILQVDEAQLAISIPGAPQNNAKISAIVSQLNALCAQHPNCHQMIATQTGSMTGLTLDGVHPNLSGYLAITSRVLGR